MALDTYRAKRDPGRTPEPMGDEPAPDALGFVVQQHDASHLHYDFRLAIDGVLASWAVPKGPSLDPGDKRLAMRTEDHPLAYGSFEGTIPEGSYGAGAVIVWDRGGFEPDGDPVAGLAKGELTFRLAGSKLRGGWRLVRMKSAEKGEPWLLMKRNDEEARREGPQPVETAPRSVLTGRTVRQVAAGVPAPEPVEDPDPLPEDVEPQLATRADDAPTGEDWICEVKLDGYRLRARRDQGQVVLRSRKGLDWTDRLPRIASAVAALPGGDLFLDGELVVLDAAGRTDFSALQATLPGDDTPVSYVVFDVLYAEGRDQRSSPLLERQQVLGRLLTGTSPPLRPSGTLRGRAADLFREACTLGLEGIVCKQADAPYTSGRGRTWLKLKCDQTATLPVIGFTTPNGDRPGFGALLLARASAAGLVDAGRVGSGFSHAQLEAIGQKLGALATDTPPLADPPDGAEVTWVEPRFAARVRFQEWTAERKVRQARFLELVPAPPREPSQVKLTSPDRVLWPPDLRKADYADLLAALSDRLLPELQDRPLSLFRCPDGLDGDGFWQKHGRPGMPDALRTRTVDGEEKLWIDDLDGLVALAQLSVLEIHVPITTFSQPDAPDRVVFDLDPAPDLGWARLASTALVLRERLDVLGLPSFVRTTGGKGLHVVVPLRPKASLDQVRAFAAGVARLLAQRDPDRYVATAGKDRRHGRVFLDWMRNTNSATAVASWSPRALAGAPVATPLAWSEIDPGGALPRFDLHAAVGRPDPWRDWRAAAVELPGG